MFQAAFMNDRWADLSSSSSQKWETNPSSCPPLSDQKKKAPAVYQANTERALLINGMQIQQYTSSECLMNQPRVVSEDSLIPAFKPCSIYLLFFYFLLLMVLASPSQLASCFSPSSSPLNQLLLRARTFQKQRRLKARLAVSCTQIIVNDTCSSVVIKLQNLELLLQSNHASTTSTDLVS